MCHRYIDPHFYTGSAESHRPHRYIYPHCYTGGHREFFWVKKITIFRLATWLVLFALAILVWFLAIMAG